MRLYEITSAEEQLALLRIIIDNTWSAIAQQAQQQSRADAERKAKASLKPRGKKYVKGASRRIPSPPLPSAYKLQPPVSPPAPTLQNKPVQANANANLKQHPLVASASPKATLAKKQYPQIVAKTGINPSIDAKPGGLDRAIGYAEKDAQGDDRHSKNGSTAQKK